MPRAFCLCVALNDFDRASVAYRGVMAPALNGCDNDAFAVSDTLRALPGFDPPLVLTDSYATYDAVLAALDTAAATLAPGDLFVLHYSGHGMKGTWDDGGPDPDPPTETDSAWILYDRPLTNYRLHEALNAFARGVRVLVISDSCHSGYAVRSALLGGLPFTHKGFPRSDRLRVLANVPHAFRKGPDAAPLPPPQAAVILWAGCHYDQTSLDTVDASGIPHGLFTASILAAWGGGDFAGDYLAFYALARAATFAASDAMGEGQDPAFFPYSADGDALMAWWVTRPFSV